MLHKMDCDWLVIFYLLCRLLPSVMHVCTCNTLNAFLRNTHLIHEMQTDVVVVAIILYISLVKFMPINLHFWHMSKFVNLLMNRIALRHIHFSSYRVRQNTMSQCENCNIYVAQNRFANCFSRHLTRQLVHTGTLWAEGKIYNLPINEKILAPMPARINQLRTMPTVIFYWNLDLQSWDTDWDSTEFSGIQILDSSKKIIEN